MNAFVHSFMLIITQFVRENDFWSVSIEFDYPLITNIFWDRNKDVVIFLTENVMITKDEYLLNYLHCA